MEMTWETDTEYALVGLANVQEFPDTWEVTRTDGWSFNIPKVPGVTPEVGSAVRFYGKGIGSVVRGVVIDGNPVYYRTPDEEAERHRQWVADLHAEKRRKFEENKAAMDAQYDALPPVFQQRIARYRANNPDFRWDLEPYELFCCEQAVLIANTLQTSEAIEAFRKLPWEKQVKAVPGLSDGHSGNTFGCATYLAKLFLTNPEAVANVPGALSPLVGSEAYQG